jgi:hypothetical protein
MTIEFECRKCRQEFQCDVGQVAIDEASLRPVFQKSIVCPRCGNRSINEVYLTELGQSQLTEATWNL